MTSLTRPSIEENRVVVTGMDCVSPLGANLQSTWSGMIEGRSGIDTIKSFDVSDYSVKIAGEALDFDPDNFIEKKEQKKMGRFIQFAMGATQGALKDAGFDLSQPLGPGCGTFLGVGMGGLGIIEDQHSILVDRGPNRVSPFFIPAVITNLASGQVSMKYGAKGPSYSVTSACATGNHSIGDALMYLRSGRCEMAIVGGSESTICPTALAGFANMKALSKRNDAPTKASRPWDKDRDGFVMGEGCGVLILETLRHALKRGARIYAEVTGYGASSDAYHMTNPSPGGEGAGMAMQWALDDAGLTPSSIGYINAHGTSTPVGDEIETQAIRRVFEEAAETMVVSSTKSMTGHLLGAAGALESIASIKALTEGIIPPTINLDEPSPENNLDYVPYKAVKKDLQHVLNNSFGFGGTNACVIFSRLDEKDI